MNAIRVQRLPWELSSSIMFVKLAPKIKKAQKQNIFNGGTFCGVWYTAYQHPRPGKGYLFSC